jgi:hypothetical protein
MYRSAVAGKPEIPITTWGEFLTEHFPNQMEYLDVSIMSPGSYPEVTPYPRFINEASVSFKNFIEDWLGKYGAVVDSDLIDALERVNRANSIS